MNVEVLMKSFSRWVIRFRWAVLFLIVLVTGGLVHATKYLTVNNDFDNWMPANDRVTELNRLVDRQFSSNALVFAVLDFTEKGVFEAESLALVARMTDALEGIPELFNVTSLTNILDIRKTEDGVEVGDLIPEIPQSRAELDMLKEYVLSKEMYVNTLVSPDADYTVLAAHIDGSADDVFASKKALEKVEEVAGLRPHYFGGDPAIAVYMDMYMNKDLELLVPLMFVVMVLILAASFRRFWGVVLTLGLVVLCISWTFGLKALFGMYASVLTPAVVVLLIAVGADYAVHIYNHYLRRGDIEVSTAEITLPVVMSAVTTIAGLLTFATTRIEILRFFGLELAFGLGSACLLSIVLLPICIRLFKAKPGPIIASETQGEHVIARTLIRVGQWVQGHAKPIVAAASVGLLVMALGFFRITINVDYVSILPKGSPPRKGHDILRDHFGGIYPVSLYLRGDIEDPALMQIQNYMENYLRSYELLSGFTSINGLVAEENWLMNGVYAVPETRQGVANLWLLLEGEELLRTFVDTDRSQSLVTAMIKDPDSGPMKDMARSIYQFLDRQTSDRVVVIDPSRLSTEGQRALHGLRLSETALQLAWLAQGYDKPRTYDPEAFFETLTTEYLKVDQKLVLDPVWYAARKYLDEEALEILSPELIDRILAHMKRGWPKAHPSELQDQISGIIAASQEMSPEDARTTAAGAWKRAESTLRLQRTATLRTSLNHLLSSALKQDKDFRKRADGVLWTLWAENPVFFASRVETIPGIEHAVTASKPVEIDQTGAPSYFLSTDSLLFVSQLQSLILASLIVLALVSVTQLSFRRGLISLLSVLVPMGFVLGLMVWLGIPLDFGTVLFGALIVGLGVDGSIHFLHYHHRLLLDGMDDRAALRATMGHVGKAVVTANGTTCCGFLVLVFSSTGALRNFAYVNSMAIFLVTASVLTFLPALVTLFRLNHRIDAHTEKPSDPV